MSWHYLQGQGAESSGDCCTGGEPLPPLRSKTTHAEFYYNGKLTESYLASLFGTMYEPLTASHGEDESMSSPEDSHAKTSAQPEREQGSQANEADSGATWLESSAMYDLATHSWRTAHSLFPEDSIPCSPILPKSGMMRSGQCWALMMSVLPTEGKESGSWPTPRKSDHKGSGQTGKLRHRLDYAVERGGTKTRQTFPTPRAQDSYERRNRKTMERIVREGGDVTLTTRIKTEQEGQGQLNPDWVEWLMGWPIGWTSLEPLPEWSFRAWVTGFLTG
jgi:hypothetical protein